MRVKFSGLLSICLLAFLTQTAIANKNAEALALKAVSPEAAESSAAVTELRALGPAGLAALIQANQAAIRKQIENSGAQDTAEWLRLSAALDAVSQQKDSYISQLYWYTDFEEAKKAAQAAGKPILSLRLLGKLSEEFSCANSRFFRTVLYSNTEVSQALRDRFILHWQTVRAVPRITIDFGDGRKLERTITGNSIHYILDADGYPIDGLPGLYGPVAFLRGLSDAEQVFKQIRGQSSSQRESQLSQYHRARINSIATAWFRDIAAIGGKAPAGLSLIQTPEGEALRVMELAVTKAVTEASILRSMTAGALALGRITDESAWNKIAALYANENRLGTTSIELIRRQTERLFAMEESTKPPDKGLNNLVKKLQQSLALDTVRNEYLLHTTLHAWLTIDASRQNVDDLNEKVYAQLFLTPRSDPWFGLYSADTYTGLDNGGVVR